MAVTQNSYTGNGSTTNYSFTFPYLKQSEIVASLDATVTTAFTIPNATTIQFNTAPASGVKIKIYRETDSDSLAATFYAGSAIKSEDLNDNFTQNLYSTQEVTERYLSNLGGTMTGDLTMGEDADIVFEGATDDAHETKLTVADPTADRTITLPNVTGTVVTTGDTGTVATAMIAGDAVTGAKIADDQINSEHYIDGSIDTAHIADLQVTTDKLASNAVTTVKILDANVTTAKIADANVTTAKIAADAITGAKIADDQINSEHYVAASIDTEHIADANVTTAKIANDAVTADKLANTAVSAGSYTAADITVDAQGRVTSAASGAIATSEITDSAVTTAKIADANVTTAKITDANVTTAKIADANVTTAKITDANVTTAKIADSNVTTAKIADSNVTTAKIADGNVTTAKLAADVIDATKIADNAVTTDHIQDAELTTLAGMQSGTASILADSTALTSTTTELNQLDGKTLGETTLTTNSNTAIPTSKAVNDRILTVTNALGGFVAIANETSFPATHPDPSDGAGTVVSVSDAGGVVVNGSGVASITNGAGSGNTVTINGFPSSLYSKTLGAGIGLQVQTTTTLHTYDYHKILAKEADVEQLSGDINDFNERYRVAGSAPGSNNDAGDLYFDTGANKMKVYNGTTSTWDDVASVGNFYINTLSSSSGTGGGSATFNGSAYRFTLSNAPTMAQQLIVSVNGVIQKPDAGSSQPSEGFAISGNDILFSAAPASGSDYFIVTQGSSVSIGTPSDNTVSTAKIQNQAVNSAKIQDGSIVNGDIADDTIAEVKLDVHNAPATGKYLKYTSNGMEWSDGASEGTDVKSTGESGTTKFLRVDGDGTCSWQVPPVTDISGKANLSGAAFTGEVDIADGEFLDFGDGGLKIRTNSNNAYIGEGTSGKLQISASNLEITNAAADKVYLYATDGGATDLYHNNNKKLETTNSGINVTGAINVNGAALSTAPQFQATASGAITAGKPVIINSNGTVTQVGESYTALSEATWAGTNNEWTSQNPSEGHVAFDSANMRAAVLMTNAGNSDSIMIMPGSVGDGDIDWTGSDNPIASGVTWGETWGLVYDDSCSKFIAVCEDGTNRLWAAAVTINGTSSSDVTWGTKYTFGTGAVSQCSVCYDSNANVTIVSYRDHGDSNKSYVRALSCNSSGVITLGTAVEITGGTCNATNLAFDSVNNKSLLLYRDASHSNSGRGNVVSVSGTTISLGSQVTFDNSSPESGSLVFDPDTGKFAYFYYYAVGGDHYGCRIMQISGTSFNYGSSFLDLQTSWNPQTDHRYHSAVYDSTLKHCIVFTRNATGAGFKGHFYKISISSSDLTASEIGSRRYWSGSTTDTEHNDEVKSFGTFYDTTHRRIHHIYQNTDESGDGHSQAMLRSSATTNLTDSNFIGLAAATVADTATATVDVTGATNTGVSGLTVGSNYYVQDSGLLSTSGTRFAGKAVAANKLIVDYLKPNSPWTLISSGNGTGEIVNITTASGLTEFNNFNFFELHWSVRHSGNENCGLAIALSDSFVGSQSSGYNYWSMEHSGYGSNTKYAYKRETVSDTFSRLSDGAAYQHYQGVTRFTNLNFRTDHYIFFETSFTSYSAQAESVVIGRTSHGNNRTQGPLTGLRWISTGTMSPFTWRLLAG